MLSSVAILGIAFFTIVIDYIIVKQKDDFKLFRLYRLRDELALVAMRNPDMQEKHEYIYLNQMICKKIILLRDNIPIVSIIKAYKEISDEEIKFFDNIIKNIEGSANLEPIYRESSRIFDEQIERHLKWFNIFIITPILAGIQIVVKLISLRNIPKKEASRKKTGVYKIKKLAEIAPNAYKQYVRY